MPKPAVKSLSTYCFTLAILIIFAVCIKSIDIKYIWQHTGLVNFSLGFVLLTAYVMARLLCMTGLPLISGYIFCGIIAGPYVSGFLDLEMVGRMRFIDDLALTFIAMTAGGELKIKSLKNRARPILINIIFQPVIVCGLVLTFIMLYGKNFDLTRNFSQIQLFAFGLLLGVISIARSPSSAIAIINECRACGPFTETILGITVAMDVLIIIFFIIAVTIVNILRGAAGTVDMHVFLLLFSEITASLVLGAVIGKMVDIYIRRAGHDLSLFLLLIAFGITKSCIAARIFLESNFHIHLSLEPLLICMSAGFIVQNFTPSGKIFMESLERISLPIYLLFFSMAGAALDIDALRLCWPLALCLCGVRVAAIFLSTWMAGKVSKDPASHNWNAWMVYITQAGVAIGLAQLTQRTAPDISAYLNTVVLAAITLNQIIGPVTFKLALNRVGETK